MRIVLLGLFILFGHAAVAADYCLLEFEDESSFPGSRIEGLISCSDQKMQDFNWGNFFRSPKRVLERLKLQGDQILTGKGNTVVGSSPTDSPYPAYLYKKSDEAEQPNALRPQEKKFCLVQKSYSKYGYPESHIAKGSEYRIYCDQIKINSFAASDEASDDFGSIADYMERLGYRMDGKIDVDPVRDTGFYVTRKYLVFLKD